MKTAKWLVLILAWIASALAAEEYQDWRLQLLEEEGLEPDAVKLNELKDKVVPSEQRFLDLVDLLASEGFAARERSQNEILRMGIAAKPWLDRLPASDDPEVEFRLAGIREKLATEQRWSRSELLQYAVNSLLSERNGKKPIKNIPLVFAELFRDKTPDLAGTYRNFAFDARPGLKGKVAEGVLRLSGRGPIDGDQRLILSAKKITGKKVFPDRFRIEVMLGGTPGGESAYHVGVSVGKVRALFHPGHAGGGFRFEHIDTHKALTKNTNMAFTPDTKSLATMGIEVKRLPDGDVELQVTVIPEGKKDRKFTTRIEVSAAMIGKIDSIGLDRSGRVGGDALFDNLVVEIPKP